MTTSAARTTELLHRFIELEEEHGLFELRARGVRYWHAIRHDVFRETLENMGLVQQAHLRLEELPARVWLRSFRPWTLPADLGRSFWTGLRPAELLVQNHPRHVPHQGRFICPYSQPLLWRLPRTRVLLEGHFQGRYFHPAADERTRYVDLTLALAHARFCFEERRGQGLSAQEVAEAHGLCDLLRRRLGGAPPPGAVMRRVRTAVLATLGLTPHYERLLDRVRPKLVVNVVGYRLVHMLLTQVARRRGIPVAELQHGMIGSSHLAYNFAPGRRPEAFPDYLLLFGRLFREMTPGLPLPAEHTPAIGYAWLELQRAAQTSPPASEPPHLLFLSQRSIGRELSRVAVELRTRTAPSKLRISFRLHPSETAGWRSRYPELARSGIEVDEPDRRGVYAALASAHMQAGVYSTSLIEGMAFGLPTFVLDLPGHEQLDPFVRRGLAVKVPDAAGLREAALHRDARVSSEAIADIWSPGAGAAFRGFVDRVVRSP